MSALDKPKREAFAQALARGLGARAAAGEAGYVNTRKGPRLALCDDISRRVQEIQSDPSEAAEPEEPVDLLERVMKGVNKALSLNSASGYAAAFKGFELAARLQGRLGRSTGAGPGETADPSAAAAHELDPRVVEMDKRLTDEEWMARYGPAPPMPPEDEI
ncbi:MAG TPA: hypothetical protein VGS12_04015 [Caulobacteraceae bacterium]|nr:hypothetical protein [Caulobacteraceae bacterium]